MNNRLRLALTIVAMMMVIGGPVLACKVPVFRFALERWPADDYRMVAITNGESSDEIKAAIATLRELDESPVNVEFEVVDLQTLSDAELWQVEGLENTEDAPLLQVFFPERDGQRALCWSGELTKANVNAWLESPLRTEIASDIQSGVSAVWVIVEGPDETVNKQLSLDLDAALQEACKHVSIPEGVIRREEASAYLAKHRGASMDDVLRSDLPLRIEFSIRTFKHDSHDEVAMAAMIAAFANVNEAPFIFPVFGRGRMIEPLPVQQFKTAAVVGACKYMVGECSCVAKALNPGVDLILNTDWQENLGEEIVMVDATITTSPKTLPIPTGIVPQRKNADSMPQESQPEGRSKTYAIILTILALATVAFSLVLRRRGA